MEGVTMCSISGFIITDENSSREAIVNHYIPILDRGRERGQDSIGVACIDNDQTSRREVTLVPGNYDFVRNAVSSKTSVLIGNNRAEPTTEYVSSKLLSDIQPFEGNKVFVSHNGVIANDKEIKNKYKIETKTRIDTAVIPSLVSKLGVKSAVQELSGSFALAIIDEKYPAKLWLSCNFKPIYIQAKPELGAIFFASRPSHLLPEPSLSNKLWNNSVVQVPPYSILEIDSNTGQIHEEVLKPRTPNKKALIICSGGLDSTTAAKWAQTEGYEITLLHFLYNCRAQEQEIRAVKKIAAALNCSVKFENLDWLGQLGGSSLTDTSLEITNNEIGAEFAHEWVPARNLVFTAMAASLCDRYDYDTLIMGLNLEEGGAYPDNTVEFYEALDHVCNIGTMSRPQIVSPLGNLVKHQIVELALDIGAPIDLSWSCYYGSEHHCGQCGPCFMRRTAFKMLGVKDSVQYDK